MLAILPILLALAFGLGALGAPKWIPWCVPAGVLVLAFVMWRHEADTAPAGDDQSGLYLLVGVGAFLGTSAAAFIGTVVGEDRRAARAEERRHAD